MIREKDCKEHVIEIHSITRFGHGDSSTESFAVCRDCGKKWGSVWCEAFPATYQNIRDAQKKAPIT